MVKNSVGENSEVKEDLAQIIRLALTGQIGDVRLYAARLVRKYRSHDAKFAEQIDLYLRASPARNTAPLRKAPVASSSPVAGQVLPIDDESKLSLLKTFQDNSSLEAPLFGDKLDATLQQLLEERRQADRLAALGLQPSRSAVFVGPPGVGKSMTARWIAAQLGLPFYVLDLTAVMSSLLGKSGSNLRAALDYAKRSPCVLFLDEIDAIAKRRSDDADVGELKRLVTVILQEVDDWPATSLLIAATNHPELVDPALWRRFDLLIEFSMPDTSTIAAAVKRFLGKDYPLLAKWFDVLVFVFHGDSISDIERSIQKFRRGLALGTASDAELIEEFIRSRVGSLERQRKIELAVTLARELNLSQHTIADITGVSRDTIRKYLANGSKKRALG